MRDRDIDAVVRAHRDLLEQVAKWRAGHPQGTLRPAVADPDLWHDPDDDIQRIVWLALKNMKDPAAIEGFHAMRAKAAAL